MEKGDQCKDKGVKTIIKYYRGLSVTEWVIIVLTILFIVGVGTSERIPLKIQVEQIKE